MLFLAKSDFGQDKVDRTDGLTRSLERSASSWNELQGIESDLEIMRFKEELFVDV